MDENKASGGSYDPYKSWDEPLFRNDSQDASGGKINPEHENDKPKEVSDSTVAAINNPNNKWWRKPEHIIGALMILINAFLAYYTFKLFDKASDQTDAAIKSANASVSSVNQQIASNIKAQEVFQLQIDAFNESKKQFEFENKPFIQIDSIVPLLLKDMREASIKIVLINVGKSPAKIISVDYRIDISDKFKNIKRNRNYKSPIENNGKSIPYGKPLYVYASLNQILHDEWNGLINDSLHIFNYGNVIYKDIYTNKKYRYDFIYKNTGWTNFQLPILYFDLIKDTTVEIK